MRKRFENQPELDAIPISEIALNTASRHELAHLLIGLQYIFVTPDLNSAIFEALERELLSGKKAVGRLGMSLWEIFVLGTVRLACNYDYDHLLDEANNHISLRGIMGVHTKAILKDAKEYKLQTLKDNVGLLTPQLLDELNLIIVKAGHKLKKNEGLGGICLNIKADSFVAESNIKFPIDHELLYQSLCKCLSIIVILLSRCGENLNIGGWRNLNSHLKKLKKLHRRVSTIHRKKGRNYQNRLSSVVKEYLSYCDLLNNKICISLSTLDSNSELSLIAFGLTEALNDFHGLVEKHIDLVDRRILQGEKIPHSEKLFSIHERHVEWINKGKAHGKIELGHQVLIATDQYHFILASKVLVGEGDVQQVIPLVDKLQEQFTTNDGYRLSRISFDRGFYSSPNEEHAAKVFDEVIMPKRGKKTVSRLAKEETDSFVAGKNAHSAVESNINELNHCGVKKVPDKGLPNFERYVLLGICAYNLRRLGKIVIAQKKLAYMQEGAGSVRKAA